MFDNQISDGEQQDGCSVPGREGEVKVELERKVAEGVTIRGVPEDNNGSGRAVADRAERVGPAEFEIE